MGNLFSGLDEFGLGELSKLKVYGDAEKKNQKKAKPKIDPKVIEKDVLFDKTYLCPVCDREFRAKTIKTGRVKLVGTDTDLRPKYKIVDPLKYDAVACPHCGYAAISRFFRNITPSQIALVKKNVSENFKGLEKNDDIYSYDDAIIRHKLALANSIVKKSKTSERAYTCLKTAWVIRGKRESLSRNMQDNKKQVKTLLREELGFILNAYEGFEEAYSKESFPMCGMDEVTVNLLVAELARRVGKNDEAGRWISQILISKDANERIKERARDIRDLIRKSK